MAVWEKTMNKEANTNRGMRTFTIIWLGQLVSTLGSGLTGFALGVWIYQSTNSVMLYNTRWIGGSISLS